MKNKIFKIIWIIGIISSVITFFVINIVNRNYYEIYNTTNYLVLMILEIINFVLGILLFKKSDSKLLYIIYTIFIIITLLIPIYHNGNTYAPTGPGSEFMGIAFKERYINMYGINIIRFIK